jgi:hypothetical protein
MTVKVAAIRATLIRVPTRPCFTTSAFSRRVCGAVYLKRWIAGAGLSEIREIHEKRPNDG